MTGILPLGKTQFFDNNGNPLSGGSITFYALGTTNLKNTYQNISLTTLNTNPVVLDAAGRALIWGSGTYTMIAQDNTGAQLWSANTSDGLSTNTTGQANVIAYGATGNGTTDDTAAIQAAITAAGNNGQVQFPAGIYLVSATLVGLPNQAWAGAGAQSTQITRTGNFGDTAYFPNGGACHVTGIWFRHLPDYSYGLTPLPNLVTSGAHLHIINGQFASVENCTFWRLAQSVRLNHCVTTKIDHNWFDGVWDPLYANAQEGSYNIWLDNTGGNNEIIVVTNNYFGGANSGATRNVTYTATDGSATEAVQQFTGNRYAIFINGCEDLLIQGNYIGDNSANGIYSFLAAGSTNLDWRIIGNFFDGAGSSIGNAQIYFSSAASGIVVNGVTISANVFNGENQCGQGITEYNPSGGPAIANFSITGNTFQAQVGSCIYFQSAVNGVISGNNFTGYNCLNASPTGADFRFSTAVTLVATTNVNVSGNNMGGAENTGTAGSYCYNGISIQSTCVNSFQSNNLSTGTGSGGAQVGFIEYAPTVVTVAGNYTALASDQTIISLAVQTANYQVVLPATPLKGRTITIKDAAGTAATHSCQIVGTIDGVANPTYATNYFTKSLVFNGISWNVLGN